jgi:transcription elongation factor GreB
MGRYRPPQPKASPYITAAGYKTLEQELKQLWERRAIVTVALSAAAAEGDRSENAEYIYRKKELREIDRRIRYLQKRLPDLRIISQTPDNPVQVFFGAWITLENELGEEHQYRIVGPDEFDPQKNAISIDSPMARALLRKNLGDEVEVHSPSGTHRYVIIEISYEKG